MFQCKPGIIKLSLPWGLDILLSTTTIIVILCARLQITAWKKIIALILMRGFFKNAFCVYHK